MNQQGQHECIQVRKWLLGAGMALWAMSLTAQAPSPSGQKQEQPGAPQQNQQKQAPKGADEANPFPGETNDVPVMPSGNQPAAPNASEAPALPPMLPSADADPVRSPDDPVGNPEDTGTQGFSSSSAGLDKLTAPPPDTETKGRRGAKNQPVPEHHETFKEDESVGSYYLSEKNWRAALSRYESAVVLDPDNPDVYWGLAEAQRHLGQFIAAKENYRKVMEYDPDSKHAKEAKKLLDTPELANAQVPATNQRQP